MYTFPTHIKCETLHVPTCTKVRACACRRALRELSKKCPHTYYATIQKIAQHICNAVLQMQFDDAVLHFQNAIAVLTFQKAFAVLIFLGTFAVCIFLEAFSDLTFPGRFSGGTFRFEFFWWDFPGRLSHANFLVGFSGRKIAWTIST